MVECLSWWQPFCPTVVWKKTFMNSNKPPLPFIVHEKFLKPFLPNVAYTSKRYSMCTLGKNGLKGKKVQNGMEKYPHSFATVGIIFVKQEKWTGRAWFGSFFSSITKWIHTTTNPRFLTRAMWRILYTLNWTTHTTMWNNVHVLSLPLIKNNLHFGLHNEIKQSQNWEKCQEAFVQSWSS